MAQNYASTSSSSSPLVHRPRLNGHRPSSDTVERTKILLLGLRRAGKTSIQQVLFNNLSPNQTFFLETTMRITKIAVDTVIPLQIWDCPANTTVESLGVPLSQFSTIIFVIDIRDLYNQPISKLVEFIVASYAENPNIILEVFVHKAEKLQEDDKIENFRQIHERVSDRLLDISPEYEQIQLNFHLTSVYDHSLHEAFSRVLHKLIQSLPFLEELLNVFCANIQSPKAFLFDTRSRLYVATDASPVDSATHNLCCDYLLMLNSFGPLYRSDQASAFRQQALTGKLSIPETPPAASSNSPPSPRANSTAASPTTTSSIPQALNQKHSNGTTASSGLLSPVSPTASALPAHSVTNGSVSNQYTSSSASASTHPLPGPSMSSAPPSIHSPQPNSTRHTNFFYPSSSTTLNTPSLPSGASTTLSYHLITKNLALLALLPSTVYEERRGLVEYNVVFFRQGVQEICAEEEHARVGE